MKPEWPLYGLCAALGLVVLAAARILDWSDATANTVAGAGLALVLWLYLPRIERRGRSEPPARSARI